MITVFLESVSCLSGFFDDGIGLTIASVLVWGVVMRIGVDVCSTSTLTSTFPSSDVLTASWGQDVSGPRKHVPLGGGGQHSLVTSTLTVWYSLVLRFLLHSIRQCWCCSWQVTKKTPGVVEDTLATCTFFSERRRIVVCTFRHGHRRIELETRVSTATTHFPLRPESRILKVGPTTQPNS